MNDDTSRAPIDEQVAAAIPQAEPEALIREARRRQRKRYLITGVVVMVLLATVAATLTIASSGSPPRRPVSRPAPTAPAPTHGVRAAPLPALVLPHAATTLVMWPDGLPNWIGAVGPPAYLDNLTSGRLTHRHVRGIVGCDCQPYVIGVGNRLVYVGGGVTWVMRADLTGKRRMLGSTPFFAPAAAPDQVWLIQSRHGRLRAWPAAVTEGRAGTTVTLPARTWLLRGTDAGLLLQVQQDRGSGLALWTPGGFLAALPHSLTSGNDDFDATSQVVAYGSGCKAVGPCRTLRIFNVVTGRMVSVPAPSGTAGWEPYRAGFDFGSEISPGNQMIAVYAVIRQRGDLRARLYVIRLSGPRRQVQPVPSSAAQIGAQITWSATGSWLLYQGPGWHLWAYQVTTGKLRRSSTPCCQYQVMAAVPNQRG